MALKDVITLTISLTALLLSLAGFFRSRRIDRLAIRQSLIDQKYAALAKEEEQQVRIFRLLIRLVAIEKESGDVASIQATLNDLMQSGRKRSKRLAELNIDHPDDEVNLILRERLGLLDERAALLTAVEAKVERLEAATQRLKQ
jgi:hypothetical protein